MNQIELHILQSFSMTCLNRDDNGAPKSALFGGATRARVSSQCWKRAIRLWAADLAPTRFGGKRGHYFAERIQKSLEARGIPAAQAQTIAEDTIITLTGKCKAPGQSGVSLYLSPGEVEALAAGLVQKVRQAGKATAGGKIKMELGEAKQLIAAAQPDDAVDIALFGRMVASDSTLSLDAASSFNHALSTHSVTNEVDYFTTVDELRPTDTAGAGHLGTLEANSACYYRYMSLNLDLLADANHLGALSLADRQQLVGLFLQAVIEAVPAARHSSMNGVTLPDYILGLVRRGQMNNLGNAFEAPIVSTGGYLKGSEAALEAEFAKKKKYYGAPIAEHRLSDADMATLIKGLIAHVL